MSATQAYFVSRTVRALELLAAAPLSAPQLANALQIDPRTARRMLTRLADEAYVARLHEPRRRYALTMRLPGVAGRALEHAELPHVAAPFVELLHTESALAAHLVVPAYDRALCVVRSGGSQPAPGLRELVPVHCTAAGKVLLSERDRWREGLLRHPLHAYTERTTTDVAAIEHEAVTTSRRGYAIEDREYRTDQASVAAPVRDRTGTTVAAIGVNLEAEGDVDKAIRHVLHVGSALTAALGRVNLPTETNDFR